MYFGCAAAVTVFPKRFQFFHAAMHSPFLRLTSFSVSALADILHPRYLVSEVFMTRFPFLNFDALSVVVCVDCFTFSCV